MRWLPVILMVLLVGCPTDDSPQGEEAAAGHPWELATWDSPFPFTPGEFGRGPGHPQVPKGPQPVAATEDTFDPALLPGSWLQLAVSDPDGVTRRPLEAMHQIDFTPNGKLVYHQIYDGDDIPITGTWEKTGPGMVRFTLGEQGGDPFGFQMYGGDFFFFVSGQPPKGYWFAKLPEVSTATIMANRFQTNLGELHFSEVVGNSFSGTVSGDTPMDVTGVYNAGVLLLDWVEPDSGNNGFAAFLVDTGWTQLNGVWWINNFAATPFGGEWTGTAIPPGAEPEV